MKTAVLLPLRLRLRAPCAGLSRFPSPSPTSSTLSPARRPLAPLSRCSVARSYASASSAAAAAASAASIPPPPPPASLVRRALTFVALGVSFGSLGFAMTVAPAVPGLNGILAPPTDAETLTLFTPADEQAMQVEEHIQNHWLTRQLRGQPETTEARPHLKIPETFRSQNLTGGTLLGPGKVPVPPLVFTEAGGKSLVSISYLGTDLCGHPGIVHGGFLATMLDEGLARCSFGALPHGVGMTANLNVNYRAPTPAGTYVVLRAHTTKAEGRKAWVEGRIETLVAEGETPTVLADATGLFISPKQAAAMATVMPVQ